MPTMANAKQPTIAIITAQYCEKLAVDSMIENKETFVRYTTVGKILFYLWYNYSLYYFYQLIFINYNKRNIKCISGMLICYKYYVFYLTNEQINFHIKIDSIIKFLYVSWNSFFLKLIYIKLNFYLILNFEFIFYSI